MTDNESPKPWHRNPDETIVWYDRFLTYLTLGSTRPLKTAHQVWASSRSNPPGILSKHPQKYDWKERVLA